MSQHGHLHRRNGPLNLRDPEPVPEPAPQNVVTSVLYVTAPQTFAGPAAYSTPNVNLGPPLQPSARPSVQAQPSIQPSPQPSFQPSEIISPSVGPSSILPPPVSSPGPSSIVSAAPSSNFNPAPIATSPNGSPSSTATANGASASPTDGASQSTGMTGGQKAGMVFGILIAIAAVLGLILFFFRRHKKQQAEKYGKMNDDRDNMEKSHFSMDGSTTYGGRAASVRTTKTASTAPRLSLRPVTQFLPNLAGDRKSGNPLAQTNGNALTPMTAQKPHAAPSRDMQHLNVDYGRNHTAQDPANPFGSHAEPSNHSTPAPSYTSTNGMPSGSAPVVAPVAPVASAAQVIPRKEAPALSGPELAAAMLTGTAAGTAVGAGLVAAAAAPSTPEKKREPSPAPAPKPEPITTSPPEMQRSPSPEAVTSPAGTVFSTMSEVPPTPIMAAGGPSAPQSAVHRVQLDFIPSMEDELELRAGQLVRLLHEYDDGWALCTRMDRSQQGVTPRTCLSTRPVKPRPMGPPGGPGSRGPSPGMRGPQGRPMGPPMGPGYRGPPPRPSSPSGGRNSPGPYGPPPIGRNSPGPYGPPSNGRNSPGPYGASSGRNSPGPQGRPQGQSPAGRARAGSNASQMSGPPRHGPGYGPGPGPSRMNPHSNSPPNPQRIPTILRAASPGPGGREQLPSRKPVPGQAI
ncbi:MAG: hypothetical protein M1814_001846 [Vezdaea aestivalis]|nr:MAG: hypothetical protein M1814_001846 [Vezdaea aestivalis]